MLRVATVSGTVATLAALLVAGPAAGAAPATVSGELSAGSAKLPKSAKKGHAQVMALNIDTAAYGAAADVTPGGRYTLKLPPGKWALLSSIVTPGSPFVAFTSAAIVTRAGQRRALPLTLKRFKKPRKPRRRRRHRPRPARVANVNPRDGRAYPGEAFAVDKFGEVGSGVAGLGNGVSDMLITDLVNTHLCEYSIVEWKRRDAVMSELAMQQTEYFDPASRVEPGHVIDPEIFIRGRVEDRPGTPRRTAIIAWLEDAKTGARLSGEVSSVRLYDEFFASEQRLVFLIQRDLICERKASAPAPPPLPVAAPNVLPTAPAEPPPPPPSPPVPPAATDVYTGTFSGEATSEAAFLTWTWSGSIRLDAAQDQGPGVPPPNGAPVGYYRTFTATSGSVDITMHADPPGECVADGTAHIDLVPGFYSQVIVQLDVASPAYVVRITGPGSDTLEVTESGGPSCTQKSTLTAYFDWASTGATAHTASSFALDDSQAILTPAVPFDYDSTTRWSLSPG